MSYIFKSAAAVIDFVDSIGDNTLLDFAGAKFDSDIGAAGMTRNLSLITA